MENRDAVLHFLKCNFRFMLQQSSTVYDEKNSGGDASDQDADADCQIRSADGTHGFI